MDRAQLKMADLRIYYAFEKLRKSAVPRAGFEAEVFLTFQTGRVSEAAVLACAVQVRRILSRVLGDEIPEGIGSEEFLAGLVHRIANPRRDQRATGISLVLFCERWREAAFVRFGCLYDGFFDQILATLGRPRIFENQPSNILQFAR